MSGPYKESARKLYQIALSLLIRDQKLNREKTAGAIRATFAKRSTHEIPKALASPPPEWEPVFDALAKECHLDLKLQEAFVTVQEFAGKLGK